MTIMLDRPAVPAATKPDLKRLALDITRKCQANCSHCFNHSSPAGTHGTMTRENWMSALDQGAEMGVQRVQFIGGEPSLHPDLADLVDRALDLAMSVEVFTNLIHVRGNLWRTFRQRGVTLATSYYSDNAQEHEAITHKRGSYKRTRANIAKAITFHIPVRAALVHVLPEQRIHEAIAELRDLGVKGTIRVDRQREIGRGAGPCDPQNLSELCGNCALGRAAIDPSGNVAGCVMSAGMLTAGNVREVPLRSVITSPRWDQLVAAIPRKTSTVSACTPDGDTQGGCTPDNEGPDRPGVTALAQDGCTPDEDSCQPSPGVDTADPNDDADAELGPDVVVYTETACNPDSDGSDCAPAETEACGPAYGEYDNGQAH